MGPRAILLIGAATASLSLSEPATAQQPPFGTFFKLLDEAARQQQQQQPPQQQPPQPAPVNPRAAAAPLPPPPPPPVTYVDVPGVTPATQEEALDQWSRAFYGVVLYREVKCKTTGFTPANVERIYEAEARLRKTAETFVTRGKEAGIRAEVAKNTSLVSASREGGTPTAGGNCTAAAKNFEKAAVAIIENEQAYKTGATLVIQQNLQRQADDARAKAEADAKAKVEADADANAKADAETRQKAQTDARAKAESEAKVKAEADAKAKASADAKARADVEAQKRAMVTAKNEFAFKGDAEDIIATHSSTLSLMRSDIGRSTVKRAESIEAENRKTC